MPGHFQSMVRSTWDFSLYGEVAKQRAGRTVGYFALLVVVMSVVLTLATVFHLRSFVRKELAPELGKWPVITIKNGVASANVPQPWVQHFDDGRGMKTIVAIDTTGRLTDFRVDEQGFILTRTELKVKSVNNPQQQSLQLADLFDHDTTIDAKWIEGWANKAVWIAGACLLVMRPVYHAGAKLFTALLLALVGLIVSASGRRRPLSFGQIYSIALYALTPAIVVDTVLDVVNLDVPHFWVAYVIMAAVYTSVAVFKVPEEAVVPPSQQAWPPSTVG